MAPTLLNKTAIILASQCVEAMVQPVKSKQNALRLCRTRKLLIVKSLISMIAFA
jgi:hypothetical protein